MKSSLLRNIKDGAWVFSSHLCVCGKVSLEGSTDNWMTFYLLWIHIGFYVSCILIQDDCME